MLKYARQFQIMQKINLKNQLKLKNQKIWCLQIIETKYKQKKLCDYTIEKYKKKDLLP